MRYSLSIVRRLLSIALLLAVSLPLAAPLLAATDADALLPACCRRAGMHHCTGATPGAGWSAVPMQCPEYPRTVTPVRGGDAVLPGGGVLFGGVVGSSVVAVAFDACGQSISLRVHGERGPPVLMA